MQVFVAVINETEYMPKILKKMAEAHYHGTVMQTVSIKHALLNSLDEPVPEFGSLNKLMNYDHSNKPTIFVVVKSEQEIQDLRDLINKVTNGIQGKGFMFAMPISFVEGINE